ncbi:tumor necrosis factor receptor superfamily member 4 [Parus major]|uniref:tumor necrosis factor receptor superfamily member 4 n=1 Tax=Parus major TaxID=9157 RepID=UPI00144411C9|nr:tumor necrosis factor receptor superfamily member 4 [Parus major]
MAGTALSRIPWNFPALCWLLAVPIPGSLSLECREHQYRFHDKCCSDCPPGECPPRGWESRASGEQRIFSYAVPGRGSEEVKPCERSSDRRCQCRAGFAPSGNAEGSECSRCPEGTFSRGGNENCQPWTNCSFFGKTTLRAGSATEDALCSSPGLDPIPTGFPENRDPVPTAFPENRDPVPTAFPESSSNTSGPREIPVVCRDPGGPAEPGWGSLSLFLLCLVLLMVSGISILLLLIQAARKKTRNGPGRSIQHNEGSCRIPVQEEHLDPNSSLTKN